MYNKDYVKGVEEAWDVFLKITLALNCKGIPAKDLDELFGAINIEKISSMYKPIEIIEKVKEWELRNSFKVGDEIIKKEHTIIPFKAIITRFDNDQKGYVYIMWDDGSTGHYKLDCFEKTGRHFPHLVEIMKSMQEENK